MQDLSDVAIAETMPRLEGNQMHTILARRPQSGGGKSKPAAATAATMTNGGRTTDARPRPEIGSSESRSRRHTRRPRAAKRFKRTKSGKFLRGKAFKQHILSSKTTKRKRGLRGTTTVAAVDVPKIARMLPYK